MSVTAIAPVRDPTAESLGCSPYWVMWAVNVVPERSHVPRTLPYWQLAKSSPVAVVVPASDAGSTPVALGGSGGDGGTGDGGRGEPADDERGGQDGSGRAAAGRGR